MKELFKDPVLFFMALSIIVACTSVGNTTITSLVFIVTSISIILKNGVKVFQRRCLLLYLGFVAIVLIYAAFGKGTLSGSTFNMRLYSFISMISVFMMSYHVKRLSSKQVKSLLNVAFIALFFSIIGTTVVSFIDPMAVRIYGFGESEGVDLELASRYYSMGMMSYPLAHGMTVVAVGLSVLILSVHSKWLKILAIVMLLLIIRLLFIMTITTALLFAVIGIAIVVSNYYSHGKPFRTICLTLLIVAAFFLMGLSARFLDFSRGTNNDISRKIADVFLFFETGSAEGQMGYRLELYRASIRTFFSNPLFGWGSDNGSRQFIGEHSYMFDFMAYYGVFAFLLFVSWWKEYMSLKPGLTKTKRSHYYYAFIPAVGLVVLKGSSVCGALPFMSLVFIQLLFKQMDILSKEI